MLKRAIQSAARSFGYEIRRNRPHDPERHHIDVFSLCMRDLLFRKSKPFILQIGANDGVRADPIRPFITEYQLPALLVEPHPKLYEILKANYDGYEDVRLVNCAISVEDGKLALFSPDEALLIERYKLSGLCSLSRDQILKELVREKIPAAGSRISQITVPAFSVSSFLRNYAISDIDVLQIDTEGHDLKILSQFDLAALGVGLINIEFFHLAESEKRCCILELTEQGYHTAFVHGDLVAYKRTKAGW
jgi:FkbM family methyltransferase